ncbi:long tail fiber proximal subunit [Aeromonas phage Ah1]|uniref:Long tail fiber proximal subunit n=1 Tax=Aeromonas phage Ah1 TaxID=2053701 RepID=A0A2H4YFS5_9CAUD|nr:tail fiber protein proximal subunit [Aeromonas phage Ah1]AUE22854.1 long tail fiber proximal subunit [Aeromonas phage Ah1]
MALQPLRATAGLDAAGKRAINFGYPDKSFGGDGVNVDFFIYENTIQPHSPSRTYPKDFAVVYNDRIYISQVAITAPEAFNLNKWKATRVDPSWRVVTSTANLQGNVRQGEYILSQVVGANSVYTMPFDAANGIPAAGDTVVVKDNGFATHDYEIVVNGNGKNINGHPTYRITLAGSTTVFIYNGTEWVAQVWSPGEHNRTYVSSSSYIPGENWFRAKVGDHLVRETQYGGGIRIRLPRYANHGDTIVTYDLDGLNPVTKTELFVYPNSGHKILTGVGATPVDSVKSDTTGFGYFIFDARTNQWRIFESDRAVRWNRIESNYTAILGEKLAVHAAKSTDTITVTFPQDASNGDSFIIDTSYMVQGSKIVLKIPDAQANDYIVPDDNALSTPYVTKYRDIVKDLTKFTTKSESLTIDGRSHQWEFTYFRNALNTGLDVWVLITNSPVPFRVDRNDTSFVGLAAIANQEEVNKNKEQITAGQNRDCEAFVTPETLANKIATMTMRGIARIATDAESKATSGNNEAWNGVIMTPEKVNNRLATETMRGVLTVATQAQANAMSGTGEMWAQTAITPKVLDGRKATETQTGITYQVIQAGAKQAERGTKGVGVHDFDEHYRYVTPKTLFEKVATDTSQGMGFTATQAEANAGTDNHANGPLFVTAKTLHGRQATTELTGLSRAVTDAEMSSNTPPTGDNIHVTPDAIVKRTANETRWGLAETATQAEVDAGVLHDRYFITPLTNKVWLDGTRLTVEDSSGLTTEGTIWKGQKFDIKLATETQRGSLRVATQAESNTMINPIDDTVITPKKLNARVATETLTGIIEIATKAEADTGTDATRAMTPIRVIDSIRTSVNHRMTDSRYGVGMMCVLANDASANTVWQGDDIKGSTRPIGSYANDNIVVSPRALNTALSHYLPILGVAESSRSMDTADGTRVEADDWIRRTVAQTITGAMKFTENVVVEKRTTRIVLNDSGTGHNTCIQYSTKAKDTGWLTGVIVLDGSFIIGTTIDSNMTPVATFGRNGTLTTAGIVSNGGQDPTNANHLTRWDYTENRYMRKTGNFDETITGFKTFQNNTTFSAGAGNAFSIKIGPDSEKAGIYAHPDGTLAIGSNGTLRLRPRSMTDATNQTSIDTNGVMTVASQVKSLATAPKDANDLTRKDYVDGLVDDVTKSADIRVNKKGDNMTGELIITSPQAITANGDVTIKELLTVKRLRIEVGNGEFLEIRPNATTRSVDFVWIS